MTYVLTCYLHDHAVIVRNFETLNLSILALFSHCTPVNISLLNFGPRLKMLSEVKPESFELDNIYSLTRIDVDTQKCFFQLKDRQQEAKRDSRYLTLLSGYVLQSIKPYTK